MSYREYPVNVVLKMPAAINAKVIGNYPIATTDPNMRFEIYTVVFEGAAVSGFTSAPVVAVGNVASTYSNQVALNALAGITVVNRVSVQSAGGSGATGLAPGTTIYLRVDTAAVATTYNLNVFVTGAYY